jgi:hypothetical protein
MFNRRVVIHALRGPVARAQCRSCVPAGGGRANDTHARRHGTWPLEPQHEFLADQMWQDHAYGRNAIYDAGEHGNAILSRFPILRWENQEYRRTALKAADFCMRRSKSPAGRNRCTAFACILR